VRLIGPLKSSKNVTGALVSSRRQCNTWAADGAFRQSDIDWLGWRPLRFLQFTLWSHLSIFTRPRQQVWSDIKLTRYVQEF